MSEYKVVNLRGGPQLPPGGQEPPMELVERVGKLEEGVADLRDRMIRVETRLDTFATKADMHKEFTSQTWRIISFFTGIAGALVAAAYFVAKHTS